MRRRARKRRTTTAWCVRVISLGRAGQGRAGRVRPPSLLLAASLPPGDISSIYHRAASRLELRCRQSSLWRRSLLFPLSFAFIFHAGRAGRYAIGSSNEAAASNRNWRRIREGSCLASVKSRCQIVRRDSLALLPTVSH